MIKEFVFICFTFFVSIRLQIFLRKLNRIQIAEVPARTERYVRAGVTQQKLNRKHKAGNIKLKTRSS